MDKTIGELISSLRKNLNLTQIDLAAKLNCSREFVSQFENDRKPIPEHYIIPLSIALDFDFETLILNLHKYNKMEHYILSHTIIDAIEEKNITKICKLIENDIVINEFNYGYPLTLKLYCEAMKFSIVYNDYIISNKVCFQVLEINDFEEITLFTPKLYKEDRYYSTILILSNNLFKLNLYSIEKPLLENTINFLEIHFFNKVTPASTVNFFFKKFYITIFNNYIDLLFTLQYYDQAVLYCEKAIHFATKNNILFLMDLLLSIKIEILYCTNKIDLAKDTYIQFKAFSEVMRNNSHFENTTIEFKSKYPKLF